MKIGSRFLILGLILAVVLVGSTAKAGSSCSLLLDFSYGAQVSRLSYGLDLSQCADPALGDFHVDASLVRVDFNQQQSSMTGNLHCTNTCEGVLAMPHPEIEVSQYTGTASFQSSGPRIEAGVGVIQTRCASVVVPIVCVAF